MYSKRNVVIYNYYVKTAIYLDGVLILDQGGATFGDVFTALDYSVEHRTLDLLDVPNQSNGVNLRLPTYLKDLEERMKRVDGKRRLERIQFLESELVRLKEEESPK